MAKNQRFHLNYVLTMTNFQKFQYGDLVKIADDLGQPWRHFISGTEAIVLGSFYDFYGDNKMGFFQGDNSICQYTVFIKGSGAFNWYPEEVLTLIKPRQLNLLLDWKEALSGIKYTRYEELQ